MQLLAEFDTGGYEAWKAEYGADAEDRMRAGLTQLQIWRDADRPGAVLCLFEINDRARAEAWLRAENALGTPVTARFLRTA